MYIYSHIFDHDNWVVKKGLNCVSYNLIEYNTFWNVSIWEKEI